MFIVVAMVSQKLSVGYLGIKEIWTNIAEWFVWAFGCCQRCVIESLKVSQIVTKSILWSKSLMYFVIVRQPKSNW